MMNFYDSLILSLIRFCIGPMTSRLRHDVVIEQQLPR